jgi:hypothetical protein
LIVGLVVEIEIVVSREAGQTHSKALTQESINLEVVFITAGTDIALIGSVPLNQIGLLETLVRLVGVVVAGCDHVDPGFVRSYHLASLYCFNVIVMLPWWLTHSANYTVAGAIIVALQQYP